MRATGEVALRPCTCRHWRPTRSTHATSTGAHARTVAGAHNTHAATVEARNGPSRPPTALPRWPTWRTVAATPRHQTLRHRGEQGWIRRGQRGREVGVPWRRMRCAVATVRARERACTGRVVAARAPRGGSSDGRWRGRRRCWRRRRRGQGGRPSSRCRGHRSRAARRHL